MKDEFNIFEYEQGALPEMEHRKGNWQSIAVIADMYEVSEQTIRNWIDAYTLDKPVNGLLNVIDVIRKVYRHQRRLLEGTGSQALTDERVRLTRAQRELAELDLQHKKGQLLDAEEVKKAAFEKARVVSEAFENIPARIGAILAAETDEFKICHILKVELDKTREELIK